MCIYLHVHACTCARACACVGASFSPYCAKLLRLRRRAPVRRPARRPARRARRRLPPAVLRPPLAPTAPRGLTPRSRAPPPARAAALGDTRPRRVRRRVRVAWWEPFRQPPAPPPRTLALHALPVSTPPPVPPPVLLVPSAHLLRALARRLAPSSLPDPTMGGGASLFISRPCSILYEFCLKGGH